MSNSLLNISMITKESLRILKNQLGLAKGVNRQYDSSFAKSGAKIGSVINIRKPVRFTVTDGAALNLQDVQDQSVALTLDKQKHVGFQFSSKDMKLSIDEFGPRYLQPAIAALANKIDYDIAGLWTDVYNSVGTPGTVPSTLLAALQCGQKLDENAAPMDGLRSMVINPAAQAKMVDALKGLFQSSEQIKSQYEKGRMGLAAGFDWMMDQNINTYTAGTYAGSGVTNIPSGAADGDTSIATDTWTSGQVSVKVGDVFTIANVYSVNPQSRQPTGSLQQFVITQAGSDTSGAITLHFSPALQSTGAYQNIDALPADGAAITFAHTSGQASCAQNLAFHRDAFVLGMADLELPGGVEMAAVASDPESGLSVRIVRAYDIVNDQHPCRIDVLYGVKTLRPELAVRFQG